MASFSSTYPLSNSRRRSTGRSAGGGHRQGREAGAVGGTLGPLAAVAASPSAVNVSELEPHTAAARRDRAAWLQASQLDACPPTHPPECCASMASTLPQGYLRTGQNLCGWVGGGERTAAGRKAARQAPSLAGGEQAGRGDARGC